MKNFAGINFRESPILKTFAGINFRESTFSGVKKEIYFREFGQNSRNFLPAKISSLKVYSIRRLLKTFKRVITYQLNSISKRKGHINRLQYPFKDPFHQNNLPLFCPVSCSFSNLELKEKAKTMLIVKFYPLLEKNMPYGKFTFKMK